MIANLIMTMMIVCIWFDTTKNDIDSDDKTKYTQYPQIEFHSMLHFAYTLLEFVYHTANLLTYITWLTVYCTYMHAELYKFMHIWNAY